MLAEKK